MSESVGSGTTQLRLADSLPHHYGDPFGEQRALVAGRSDVEIGRWAFEAVRIADGEPGLPDAVGPGEELVFLHLDGSDNVLPQPGDLIYPGIGAPQPIGRVTSVANHYELGPIALAAIKLPDGFDSVIVQVAESGATHSVAANVQRLPL